MNLLENLIHVALDFNDVHEGGGWTESAVKQLDNLVSRQQLSVRLRISFKPKHNTKNSPSPCGGGDADAVVTSSLLDFLSQVGEDSFIDSWKRLFEWVVVVPFLMPRAEVGEEFCASLDASGDVGAFCFGIPSFWEDCDFAQSVPEEPLQGYGVKATNDNNSQPTEGCRSSCWLAGSAMEVQCSSFSAIEASVPVSSESSGPAIAIPQSIVSEYVFNFTVPEVGRALQDTPSVLAFVLVLPFGAPNTAATSPTGENESNQAPRSSLTSSFYQRNPRYILMKVLFRALLDLANDNIDVLFGRERGYFLPFSCYYTPIRVRRALDLMSVTFPLSNDRLLLNLSITNVSGAPITLYGATFDLYTSDVWSPVGGGESSGKPSAKGEEGGGGREPAAMGIRSVVQHPGPSGANLRTLDVLTKIVTITPMTASDDRPPFSLQPQESYSFHFVVEVIPQLCYLLNPDSLQYVYEAYWRDGKKGEGPDADAQRTPLHGAYTCGGKGGGPAEGCVETVVKDCYDSPVSKEELLRVLRLSYVSQVYVCYSLGNSVMEGSGGELNNTQRAQHSTQWSFAT